MDSIFSETFGDGLMFALILGGAAALSFALSMWLGTRWKKEEAKTLDTWHIDASINGEIIRLFRDKANSSRYYDTNGTPYVYLGAGSFMRVYEAAARMDNKAMQARYEAEKLDSDGPPDTVVTPAVSRWPVYPPPKTFHAGPIDTPPEPPREDRRRWPDTVQTGPAPFDDDGPDTEQTKED